MDYKRKDEKEEQERKEWTIKGRTRREERIDYKRKDEKEEQEGRKEWIIKGRTRRKNKKGG